MKRTLQRRRKDHEEPYAISRRGWRYHHVGIPTTAPHPDDRHLRHLGIFVRSFDTSPFGIECTRHSSECQVHELVRSVPHVAFEVDDLEKAVKGFKMLSGMSPSSEGVRVAMIVHDDAPIELLEFSKDGKGHRTRQ